MGRFFLSRHPITASSTDTRTASTGTENASRSMKQASAGTRVASAGTRVASAGIKAASADTQFDSTGEVVVPVETDVSPRVGQQEMWREYCKAMGVGAAYASMETEAGREEFRQYCAAQRNRTNVSSSAGNREVLVLREYCKALEAKLIGTNATQSVGGDEVFREYCTILGIDMATGATSFDDRVRKEYTWHTVQYWLVASLANGLLWAQIVIGAALTALGATRTHASQTATIYLGAASTIIAGLLTYFKSRNQPNRARQFRQALRAIRNRIDDTVGDLQEATPAEARELARDIMKQYKDALADAENNYPDDWMTLATLKKFLPGDGSSDQPAATKSQLMGLKSAIIDHYQASGQDMTTGIKVASHGKEASGASDTDSPESSTGARVVSNERDVPIAPARETQEVETPGQKKSWLSEEDRQERKRRWLEEREGWGPPKREERDEAAGAGEETRSSEKMKGSAMSAEADMPGRQFAEKDIV